MAPTQLPLSDRIAIADADFGWQVLSASDKPLATLTNPQCAEMFLTSYIVTPLDGYTVAQSEDFWYPNCHRIRNIGYPDFVVDTFGHFNPQTNRATLRFAYINVDFNWADRLCAPMWFLRRWFK
ncbi:MAG: hypothetical protein AB8G99_22955 [Planctomycetaceae bacterium]